MLVECVVVALSVVRCCKTRCTLHHRHVVAAAVAADFLTDHCRERCLASSSSPFECEGLPSSSESLGDHLKTES